LAAAATPADYPSSKIRPEITIIDVAAAANCLFSVRSIPVSGFVVVSPSLLFILLILFFFVISHHTPRWP
jgi:hypothetical protein